MAAGERVTVRALYDYEPQRPDELRLHANDELEVLSQGVGDGWWHGTNHTSGQTGYFPSNYVAEEEKVEGGRRAFSLDGNASPDSERPVSLFVADSPDQEVSHVTLDETSLGPSWIIPFEELTFGECIGIGGFGAVYRGEWRGAMVAIKSMAHIFNTSEEKIENTTALCEREAKYLASFSHPNIIEFKGACLDYPHLCVVMEYASQGSLYGRLRAEPLPPSLLVEWALQLANGMHYLSVEAPQTVIHRDLKSQNVLIGNDGQLRISDFGVARRTLTHSTKMSTAGTYAWMAPESIRSQHYSHKSDVWSFGVILWEMLTDQIPYPDIEPFAIAYGVATYKLKLPIPSSCPAPFQTLLNNCWQQDPSLRPSFHDICVQLRTIQKSEFPVTPPASFSKLQNEWQPEITAIFDDLRTREKVLKEKEEELLMAEGLRRRREEELMSLEVDLRRKEDALIVREHVLQLNAMKDKRRTKNDAERHLKSRSMPEICISAPFGFRHVSHIGPNVNIANMEKVLPDWNRIVLLAGLSSEQLQQKEIADFVLDFTFEHMDPYEVVGSLLYSNSPELTSQTISEELNARLAKDLAAAIAAFGDLQKGKNDIQVIRLKVFPPHVAVGESASLRWSGYASAKQRDWIGLVPKNGKNRDAVVHHFLNSQTFGLSSFLMKKPGEFEVRIVDKGGKTLAQGNTIVVTGPVAAGPAAAAPSAASPSTPRGAAAAGRRGNGVAPKRRSVTWTSVFQKPDLKEIARAQQQHEMQQLLRTGSQESQSSSSESSSS